MVLRQKSKVKVELCVLVGGIQIDVLDKYFRGEIIYLNGTHQKMDQLCMARRDYQPSGPSEQQLERDLSVGGAGFLGTQQPRMVSYVTALFHLCKNNC